MRTRHFLNSILLASFALVGCQREPDTTPIEKRTISTPGEKEELTKYVGPTIVWNTPRERNQTDHFGDPLPPNATTRLGSSRLRHAARVNSVAFSPDNKVLVSGSLDNSMRLWDVATGKELGRYQGDYDEITSVVYSHDGKVIASVSQEHARLWDGTTGHLIHELHGALFHSFTCVAFSPDSTKVAVGAAPAIWDTVTLHVWEVRTGKKLHESKVGSVQSLAFSPDGASLVLACRSNKVCLWTIAEPHGLRELGQHDAPPSVDRPIRCVAFSPDGTRLASGGWESKIRLWDAFTGKETLVINGPTESVNALSFSPDGKTLASASGDGTLRIWDSTNGVEKHRYPCHKNGSTSIAFSRDGKRVAVGGGDGWGSDSGIRIWDVISGQEVSPVPDNHTDRVNALAFSPNGRTTASGSDDQSVRIWDSASGRLLRKLDGHTGTVQTVAYAPDGETLASGGTDGSVIFWDTRNGAKIRQLVGTKRSPVHSIAFSPDGTSLAAGCGGEFIKTGAYEGYYVGGEVRLFDVATGKRRATAFTGSTSAPPVSVAFSSDKKFLVAGDWYGKVHMWDLASGRASEVRVTTGHWHLDHQVQRAVLVPPAVVTAVAVAPDGKTLVAATGKGQLHIIEIDSGKELLSFAARVPRINTVAFSPDGKTIAYAGDHTLRLWEPGATKESLELKGHDGPINCVAFSPDGKSIVSGSTDVMSYIWQLTEAGK